MPKQQSNVSEVPHAFRHALQVTLMDSQLSEGREVVKYLAGVAHFNQIQFDGSTRTRRQIYLTDFV
jgi:hypothetical protein